MWMPRVLRGAVSWAFKMWVYSISDTEFELDLRWTFESVTNYLDVLTRILALSEVSVPYTPKRILGRLAPYHLAGRMMVLFDFAKGQKAIDRRYVEEVMCDYARMMTLNVLAYTQELAKDDDDDDDDDDAADSGANAFERAYDVIASLQSHACPVIMMGAYARAKMNEGRAISEIELRALTGLDAESAPRKGITQQANALFDGESVKRYLALGSGDDE